jgi:hypothetical protein
MGRGASQKRMRCAEYPAQWEMAGRARPMPCEGNWISRIGERIGPLLLEMRMNDLPHNREPQMFFALEVMKQCAFRRSRIIYDAIEATALESVFVKFVESGIEDSLSRVFGRPVGGYSHCASINQYRPVGMSSSSILLFSILGFDHLTVP